MKLIIIFFACIMAASLASCKKDVLNKEPLGEISSDLVFKDVNMATLFVDGIYLNLFGGIERNLDCATEIADDGPEWHPVQAWNSGDVTGSYNALEDWYSQWGTDYKQIRSANLVLEKVANLKGDPEKIGQLRGQAFFLRAYFYSDLLQFYGGVPIIKKAQKLGDDLNVSRNSYEECISFIVADLDSASELLPLMWEGSNVGRATKGAALAIKSRMLLHAASPLHNTSNDPARWQAAANAAKAVIDLDVYELHPDYYKVFHEDNNQEVIFDIQYAYPTRVQHTELKQNPQGMAGAWGELRPTEEFVSSYAMNDGKKITDPSSGYNPQDPYKDRDPRFYATVLYNGAPWRGEAVETFVDGAHGPGNQDIYNTGVTMTGYYTRKFINEKNINSQDVIKSEENWILMRYAEVLLNYAEAQLHLGNEAEAKVYINKIRERAGMPSLAGSETGAALMALYQNERKLELAFEEIYFFDVRRWKTAPSLLSVPVHKMHIIKNANGSFTYNVKEMEDRVWRDAFYYYPIPIDEINKNSNLDQNPGY